MNDAQSLARAVHASGRRLVLAVAGGASRALSELVTVPGASRSVLEARVPYCDAAMGEWLGGPVGQSCSEPAARAMAAAAWRRARQLDPAAPPEFLLGAAATAALATDRPKRGEHRLHVATHSADVTRTWSLHMEKSGRTRDEEETLAAELLLLAIAHGTGIDVAARFDAFAASLGVGDKLEHHEQTALPGCRELFTGERQLAMLPPEAPTPAVVFPGSFNPPHRGHLRMAELAEKRHGPVAWELSVSNVEKPPLDHIEIHRRVDALRKLTPQRPVALTEAPTFREKAALFPGCVFCVGADTILRIADPAYYAGDPTARDRAIEALAQAGCRFLVFARVAQGSFLTLGQIDLPPGLQAITDEVLPDEFRDDISSTELRKEG